MKQLIFIILLIFSAKAYSQNGVIIHQDPRIDIHMNKLTTRTVVVAPTPAYIYRIQLISTYDRNEANKTQSEFRATYPGKESFLSYSNPKYIVRVGKYRSEVEAKQKLAELRKKFPYALLLPPQRAQ